MSATEAVRAAGVSRSWRAASRSLTGLRPSFSLDLHAGANQLTGGWAHSATGWGRLHRCAASPAAAQISELDLKVNWPAAPQAEVVPSADEDDAHQRPLKFLALQQLHVRFEQALANIDYVRGVETTELTTSLLNDLVRGCPQLQQLRISIAPLPVTPQRRFLQQFQPLSPGVVAMSMALSPLEAILAGAAPSLKTVTVRKEDGKLSVALCSLPGRGQLASLVLWAPEVRLLPADGELLDAWTRLPINAAAGEAAALTYAQPRPMQQVPQALVFQTQRLVNAGMDVDDLELLLVLCNVKIRGYSDVQRPALLGLHQQDRSEELRALLESMMQDH